jgi:hypothetical protein
VGSIAATAADPTTAHTQQDTRLTDIGTLTLNAEEALHDGQVMLVDRRDILGDTGVGLNDKGLN